MRYDAAYVFQVRLNRGGRNGRRRDASRLLASAVWQKHHGPAEAPDA
jgi:hypothetical protein